MTHDVPLTLFKYCSEYLKILKELKSWIYQEFIIFAKILQNLPLTFDCMSKVRGRFRKILWPSQNIWTLPTALILVLFKKVSFDSNKKCKSSPYAVFWNSVKTTVLLEEWFSTKTEKCDYHIIFYAI